LDKCVQIVLEKRKLVQLHSLNLNINREIQELEQRETCTYVGVEEGTYTTSTNERLKI